MKGLLDDGFYLFSFTSNRTVKDFPTPELLFQGTRVKGLKSKFLLYELGGFRLAEDDRDLATESFSSPEGLEDLGFRGDNQRD